VVNGAVTQRAKILIVEIPSLLREIIEEMVADEDDMEVVGELPDHGAIVELVEQTGRVGFLRHRFDCKATTAMKVGFAPTICSIAEAMP